MSDPSSHIVTLRSQLFKLIHAMPPPLKLVPHIPQQSQRPTSLSSALRISLSLSFVSAKKKMAEVEKIEAMNKCQRTRKATKYVDYIVVSATTAAISCFVLWFPSLVYTVKTPLRVLCLVVIPELWVLWQNPGFLFIVSNVIILILAAKSGMLSNANGSHSGLDLYAEFIKKSESIPKYNIVDDMADSDKPAERVRNFRRQEQTVARTGSHVQDKSTAEGSSASSSLIVVGNEATMSMSDEELNKRVEDFIANFNRQLRLQRQRSWSHGGR